MSEVLLAGARVQLMPAHSCISVTFALPKMELTNRRGKGNNVSQQTLDTCVPQSDGSTVQFMHGEIGESKNSNIYFKLGLLVRASCVHCLGRCRQNEVATFNGLFPSSFYLSSSAKPKLQLAGYSYIITPRSPTHPDRYQNS
jgi:hypothetical protein